MTMVEPSATDPEKNMDSVVWCVHGASLLRCTHEQLRPETPEERNQREQENDDFGNPGPLMDRIGTAMSRVRGPVNYYDLRKGATPGTEAPAFEEPVMPTPKKARSEAQPPATAEPSTATGSEAPAATVTVTASTATASSSSTDQAPAAPAAAEVDPPSWAPRLTLPVQDPRLVGAPRP